MNLNCNPSIINLWSLSSLTLTEKKQNKTISSAVAFYDQWNRKLVHTANPSEHDNDNLNTTIMAPTVHIKACDQVTVPFFASLYSGTSRKLPRQYVSGDNVHQTKNETSEWPPRRAGRSIHYHTAKCFISVVLVSACPVGPNATIIIQVLELEFVAWHCSLQSFSRPNA